ncbi:MAG TPA: complement resistance protein TraT [Gammaproteobacteria bacterium]|nr:complement resistance protein TraT [Gammaproteobacteria bacterium]
MLFLKAKAAFKATLLISVLALLVGCGATHPTINKRKLDVQTKMSPPVFLDPMISDKKTVYLQIRNTSDKPELDLEHSVAQAMLAKGYTRVMAPEQAQILLQTNILQAASSDLRAADHALNQGFGTALGGAVTDTMIRNIVYVAIADVQISERVGNSVTIKEKTRSRLKQGTNGVREIISTEKIEWKLYQARVVSTATKVNLKFKQAAPELIQGLTRSITGIF